MGRPTAAARPGTDIRPGGRLAPDPGNSRRLLDQGIHPASMLPLLDENEPPRRCGQCARLWIREASGRRFTKCANAAATNRSGPDIRPDMPACEAFILESTRVAASPSSG
jgi:hypothetical protein